MIKLIYNVLNPNYLSLKWKKNIIMAKLNKKMSGKIYLVKYHDPNGNRIAIKGIFDDKEDAEKEIIKQLDNFSYEHSFSLHIFDKNKITDGKLIYSLLGKNKAENPWD